MKAIKLGSIIFLVSLVSSLSFVAAYQYYFKTETYQVQSGLVLLGATITVPDDYPTIQEAINYANDGDTVFVRNGTYYENVVVNKTVSLIGESKDGVIIDGSGVGNTLEVIGTYGTIIRGFRIQNGWSYGIFSYLSGALSICDNIISDNLYGIRIEQSSDTEVTDNVVSSNSYGISNWYSSASNISNNLVVDNSGEGIIIAYSRYATLRNNTIAGSSENFGVWSYGKAPYGSTLDFFHDIDTTNTVDGRSIYYWVNRHNETIPEDAGYVGIVNSTNIVIENQNLSKNGQSILIALSENVTVTNVTVSNSLNGIRIVRSSFCRIENSIAIHNNHGIFDTLGHNNTIVRNELMYNEDFGIAIANSNSTTITDNTLEENKYGIVIDGNPPFGGGRFNNIYHNNFINNSWQVYPFIDMPSNNTWDNGCEGNYWSNYNGTDLDGDGIGDTYLPWGGVDYYPLMNPHWNPADIDHDLDVDIFDVVLAANAYGSTPSDPNWNPHCDIAEPYGVIDIFDVVMIAGSYGKEYNP